MPGGLIAFAIAFWMFSTTVSSWTYFDITYEGLCTKSTRAARCFDTFKAAMVLQGLALMMAPGVLIAAVVKIRVHQHLVLGFAFYFLANATEIWYFYDKHFENQHDADVA